MNSPFQDAKFEKKPSGFILIDGQEVAHTLKCVHCNTHFVSVRGSGTRRGWCFRCKGVECGSPQCFVCVPAGAKLDYVDNGNGSKSKRWDQDIKNLIGKFKDLRI